MKRFELMYVCLETFLPPLHAQVRRRLVELARARVGAEVLDVGGRKSHYTIGVPGRITITDLARTTAQQVALNLGVTDSMMAETRARRSNVHQILLDDMTRSSLPDESFDCVVAVEVLEHVNEDRAFVEHVYRVLKPGGVFLMSTPNGDSVKVANPDHVRHYRREELRRLLADCFDHVEVEYAIRGGRARTLGLRPWSVAQPLRTLVSMVSNVVNRVQSARADVKHASIGTRHLIASASKSATSVSSRRLRSVS